MTNEQRRLEIMKEDVGMTVRAAPGVLDRDQVVAREPGETTEQYDARCDLFRALKNKAGSAAQVAYAVRVLVLVEKEIQVSAVTPAEAEDKALSLRGVARVVNVMPN